MAVNPRVVRTNSLTPALRKAVKIRLSRWRNCGGFSEHLARHSTAAGLTEKAARLWAKAAQRSLERSALGEACDQFNHALSQIVRKSDCRIGPRCCERNSVLT